MSEFPHEIAKNVKCVFTDIDDTLTNGGQLGASAYAAMHELNEAGIYVVPVTGRPAGWCDMIARLWPVAGVVGENGAFYFSYDKGQHKMLRFFYADARTRQENRTKLDVIRLRVIQEVPECAISADQLYRECDLAIDFCEDVPALVDADVQRIKEIFEEEGAVAKISSIHVNGWFGDFDKLTMSRSFAEQRLGIDIEKNRDAIVFCGDSPNDSPMFKYFPYACGVANVRDFEGKMQSNPAYVSKERGGEGFVEIANTLLNARR